MHGRASRAPRPLACAAAACKRLSFEVEGVADKAQAQAHRGGVPLDGIDAATLALAAPVPAVYACGAVLDMDADCGGFNLAWAWLSGMRAGEAAARAVRSAGALPR